MSILGEVFRKVLRERPTTHGPSPGQQQAEIAVSTSTRLPGFGTPPSVQSGALRKTRASQPVDLVELFDEMAAKHPRSPAWRHSIVDLLDLLDIDTSPATRRALAKELHYGGDLDVGRLDPWLHRNLMRTLAENGAIVPRELCH